MVQRYTSREDLMSSGQINCSLLNDAFYYGTLREGSRGVIVFDVFIGDPHDIMTHQRCLSMNVELLNDTLKHFVRNSNQVDLNTHLKGWIKAPYKFFLLKIGSGPKDY